MLHWGSLLKASLKLHSGATLRLNWDHIYVQQINGSPVVNMQNFVLPHSEFYGDIKKLFLCLKSLSNDYWRILTPPKMDKVCNDLTMLCDTGSNSFSSVLVFTNTREVDLAVALKRSTIMRLLWSPTVEWLETTTQLKRLWPCAIDWRCHCFWSSYFEDGDLIHNRLQPVVIFSF